MILGKKKEKKKKKKSAILSPKLMKVKIGKLLKNY